MFQMKLLFFTGCLCVGTILGFSVDTKWAIPCNVCNSPPPPPPPTPIEVQGNPKGREGVSKVIYEGVAMSVPLISQKHLPFLVGVHTLNGMAQWHPTA